MIIVLDCWIIMPTWSAILLLPSQWRELNGLKIVETDKLFQKIFSTLQVTWEVDDEMMGSEASRLYAELW